jgi:hypothetical protein
MHPKSEPLSFCGENIHTSNYQWVLQVLQTFPRKMSELMESLEYARAYLDDLLCISRSSLEDHLEILDEVLRQLHDAGLKVNADELTFCTLEIEFLGYILTRDAIKPQSNKVQEILMIPPPKGVKQL